MPVDSVFQIARATGVVVAVATEEYVNVEELSVFIEIRGVVFIHGCFD